VGGKQPERESNYHPYLMASLKCVERLFIPTEDFPHLVHSLKHIFKL
jgi:hypothetical protein